MSWIQKAGLLLGLGLFVWVLSSADLLAVWEQLRAFQWRFAMVFGFYVVIFGLDTLGWKFAFGPRIDNQLRWDRLFRTRLAGEAVNYITPSAWIGGEPVKAALLSKRYGVPLTDGIASVVVAKTTFAFSMLLFIILGLWVTAATRPVSASVVRWVWVVLPTLSVLLILFLLVQFFQPFRRSFLLFRRLAPNWFARVESKLEQLDHAVGSFYRDFPRSVFWSFGFHFLGWVAGAIEVYLIFYLLNFPISFATACSIEALWILLKSGAFLIPATIGVSEGILLFLCAGLGIHAVPALALALIRRARELAWVGLGLVEFSRKA